MKIFHTWSLSTTYGGQTLGMHRSCPKHPSRLNTSHSKTGVSFFSSMRQTSIQMGNGQNARHCHWRIWKVEGCLKSTPLVNPTCFQHLNTGYIWFSDPHCKPVWFSNGIQNPVKKSGCLKCPDRSFVRQILNGAWNRDKKSRFWMRKCPDRSFVVQIFEWCLKSRQKFQILNA